MYSEDDGGSKNWWEFLPLTTKCSHSLKIELEPPSTSGVIAEAYHKVVLAVALDQVEIIRVQEIDSITCYTL